MPDRIFDAFLRQQKVEGEKLAAASDLLQLVADPDELPRAYLAHFSCKGLVRAGTEVKIAEHHVVGIHFPSDYLRRAEPFEIIHWLSPANIFHPNISDNAPIICIGRLAPGTPLVDILQQVFEIISYSKVTMREDDALNHDACVWARNNQQRFPVDNRPLRRTGIQPHADPFAGVVIEEVTDR